MFSLIFEHSMNICYMLPLERDFSNSWVERFTQDTGMILYYCRTDGQRAGILTKGFAVGEKFEHAGRLVGVIGRGVSRCSENISQGGSHNHLNPSKDDIEQGLE